MIAMYLSRQLTGASFLEIGLRFGGKDHSTVINACKRIESIQSEDSELRETVAALRQLLAHEPAHAAQLPSLIGTLASARSVGSPHSAPVADLALQRTSSSWPPASSTP